MMAGKPCNRISAAEVRKERIRLEDVPDADLHLPARRKVLDPPQTPEDVLVDPALGRGVVAPEAKRLDPGVGDRHAIPAPPPVDAPSPERPARG